MKQPHTDLESNSDFTRKQDRTVLLRAFGKKASHPLKELDEWGVSQILRAMEEHAKEGRNQQSCDVEQKLVQSTERRTLLKEDVGLEVADFNVCQARKTMNAPRRRELASGAARVGKDMQVIRRCKHRTPPRRCGR